MSRNKAIMAMTDLERQRDVGKYLRELGIQGHRNSPCQCPLAQYFEKKTGDDVAVQESCFNDDGDEIMPGLRVIEVAAKWSLPLPEHVTQYIREFDAGLHPGQELPRVD